MRSSPRSRRVRRAVTATLVAVLSVIGGTAVGAGERTPATTPRTRLAHLERQIGATERSAQRLHEELLLVAEAVVREELQYEALLARLDRARAELEAAAEAYAKARTQLDERVRAAYMEGPSASLQAVFGASSLDDLALALKVQDRVADLHGQLARQAGRLERVARESERTVSDMTSRQSELLARLDRQRVLLTDTFAEQQRLLAELTASRRELNRLLREVPERGRGQTGIGISFGEWAGHFLRRLGTPDCRSNRVAVVAWETAEYTQARWNPLATTFDVPGATNFNSVGVKNYRSLEQGLDASVSTLLLGVRDHGYGAIIGALAECAEPKVTAAAINASDWCHGCAGGRYVIELVPAVESYFDDYASR